LRAMSGPAAGVEVTEKGGVELVLISGGEFLMGSPPDEVGRFDNEGPQRRVKVSPFWLGRYPVTNEQYGRFLSENPHIGMPSSRAARRFNQAHQPVVGVSWNEARAFAEWAGGRLPTEAEWEYACRAGTARARYEEDLDSIAWYSDNSDNVTPPVGEKKPNAWGLHDMLGNIYEWCSDWFGNYSPDEALVIDPQGPRVGSNKVIRGGYFGSLARYVRAAARNALGPSSASLSVGFRLVRSFL